MIKTKFQFFAGSIVLITFILGIMQSCDTFPGDEIAGTANKSTPILFVKEPIGVRENSVMRSNVDEFNPGTDIVVLSPASPGGNLTNLTHAFHQGEGAAMDPEISPDGSKILFSMKKNRSDNWRIYEMDTDGSNLLQLTSPPVGDDFDPAYLPNDKIVFVSTRNQIVDEYERRTSPQLHIGERSEEKGTIIPNEKVRQISFNQSHDANPMVHSSGKIYFSRWEHLGNINKFTLFSINPDGTGLFFLDGSHTPSGDGSRVMLEPRELGDKGLAVSVMTRNSPHEGGAIAILDLSRPETELSLVTASDVLWDNNGDQLTKALFKTPFPVLDGQKERLLVSMSPLSVVGNMSEPPVDYGIYIMDKNGENLSIVYNDPDYNELDPMPLKTSHIPSPEIIETQEGVTEGLLNGLKTGKFFNSNAYLRARTDGQMRPDKDYLNPDGVIGEARYYRILEAISLPRDRDKRGNDIGNTNLEKERVLGYVPIQTDGSSSMEVPANQAVHLQSLDYNGMKLVSQRTWVQVMPGELRMCTGCHGDHNTDPDIFNFALIDSNVVDTVKDIQFLANFTNSKNPTSYSPSGTGYVPVKPDTLDFYRSTNTKNLTIQNIFNNQCNSCHGASTAATKGGGFNLSHQGMDEEDGDVSKLYEDLTSRLMYNGGSSTYASGNGARYSPLIWVLFNKQLDSKSGDYSPTSFDHTSLWEKLDGRVNPFLEANTGLLTLIEWIDMGRQYSNTIGYEQE